MTARTCVADGARWFRVVRPCLLASWERRDSRPTRRVGRCLPCKAIPITPVSLLGATWRAKGSVERGACPQARRHSGIWGCRGRRTWNRRRCRRGLEGGCKKGDGRRGGEGRGACVRSCLLVYVAHAKILFFLRLLVVCFAGLPFFLPWRVWLVFLFVVLPLLLLVWCYCCCGVRLA